MHASTGLFGTIPAAIATVKRQSGQGPSLARGSHAQESASCFAALEPLPVRAVDAFEATRRANEAKMVRAEGLRESASKLINSECEA